MIPDLNLCLATGRVTSGIKDVELDPQVKKTFEGICKALNKFNCNIFPCFPAKDHTVGRYKSVLRGLYDIYPSPFVVAPSFLEVRFKTKASLAHVDLREYGVSEATLYSLNVVALGDYERLRPTVMAQALGDAFGELFYTMTISWPHLTNLIFQRLLPMIGKSSCRME
jgi:hypothetical protein